MVIRYEFTCPECQKEFFTSNIYPECPRCGYKYKEEVKEGEDEESS